MRVIKFQNVVDESEFTSWQVLVSELDSTLNRLRCIRSTDLVDAHEMHQFTAFWDKVETEEAIVVSVTENSNLYELNEDNTLLILSQDLEQKMIIFDKDDKSKIISKIEKME